MIDTSGYVPSIVRASARLLAGAVEHYTFVSTQSVYSNFDAPGVDESAPVKTLTDEQVREAEKIVPLIPRCRQLRESTGLESPVRMR